MPHSRVYTVAIPSDCLIESGRNGGETMIILKGKAQLTSSLFTVAVMLGVIVRSIQLG